MSPTTLGLIMFGGMLLLMAVRVPIAAAMFIPGALGYWALTNETALLNQLKGTAVARLTVYDLSVIPLFLLMGQFATQGGLSRALFQAAAAFLGHIRGGLAMASVMAAGAFGAVCGSSVATSATITQVAYPQMKAHGYAGGLSTATLATGGITSAKMGKVTAGGIKPHGEHTVQAKGKTKGTMVKMSGSKPLGMKKGGKAYC